MKTICHVLLSLLFALSGLIASGCSPALPKPSSVSNLEALNRAMALHTESAYNEALAEISKNLQNNPTDLHSRISRVIAAQNRITVVADQSQKLKIFDDSLPTILRDLIIIVELAPQVSDAMGWIVPRALVVAGDLFLIRARISTEETYDKNPTVDRIKKTIIVRAYYQIAKGYFVQALGLVSQVKDIAPALTAVKQQAVNGLVNTQVGVLTNNRRLGDKERVRNDLEEIKSLLLIDQQKTVEAMTEFSPSFDPEIHRVLSVVYRELADDGTDQAAEAKSIEVALVNELMYVTYSGDKNQANLNDLLTRAAQPYLSRL